MMKKIITIVGARPQFIKLPLVSREIRKFAREIIVHTGQHYDTNMSEIFFQDLKLPQVDYNLNVGSATHGKQTARMLERIEQVLLKEKPDMVLIYGDTNSTIAGALAAAKLHIPVAHVEAGLRSYNWTMPEEINRVASDHICDLLLAPTRTAVQILKKEGIKKDIYFVGDVMADLQREISQSNCSIVKKLGLHPKEYLLVTVHRQENTDKKENLTSIFQAFQEIKEPIIYPIHPRTRKYLKIYHLEKIIAQTPHLRLIEPVSYSEMICLEKAAKMILTDSGGVQKEAYLAKVPCITLRDDTEWPETVKAGWNYLAGAHKNKILKLYRHFPKPKSHPNFLGHNAAQKIAKIIKNYLK